MSADTVTPAPSAPATAPVSRRHKWFRRLLPPVTLIVLGVWFAPAIVAKTGLRNHFARQALADLRGSVEVGSASLGWFSPVELRDVTIKDEAGRTLASVPKITSAKSLLGLARNRAEPGEFTLESPTVAVVFEKDTTNIEAAFAEYLKETQPAAPMRTPVTIRVTGGTLTFTDAETGKITSAEGIAANVAVPASRSEPVTAKLTATTGNLGADVSLGESGSAKLTSAGFPLETLAPILKRVAPELSVAGMLTSDLRVSWGKDSLAIAGSASAKQLAVAAEWLNGDTLRLDSAELPFDVELTGRVLRVRKFDLTCDVGSLSVAGNFDPGEAAEKLLARPGVTVKGNVELARLATKLPKLLRIKDGTELREGRLEVTLASRADGAGAVWDGTVHASAIKATRAGKPINWDEPLHVEFIGRYAPGQLPTFDKLICTSDFIAVNARTTPETVQAAANVYLHRLGSRLAEFIDLGGVTLDGEAGAQLVGRREPDGTFRAGATVELKNFAFTSRSGKGLKEPSLTLQIDATGKMPAGGPIHLATATATLAAGGDELRLALLEPVGDLDKLASGLVDVRMSGDVTRWKARVGALMKIPAYQMSGAISASGKVKLSPERVTVDGLTLGLKKVKFRGAGLNIDEAAMSAVGDFTFKRASRVATIEKLTINSSPLTVTDRGILTFDFSGREVVVSGSGQCVTDLNRLGASVKLYADPRGPDALYGRGVGPIRFHYMGDVTTFGGTLDVTNFAYGPKGDSVWEEPTLRLEADGSYTDSTDTVAFKLAKVERPGLVLGAGGAIGKATTTQEVSFSGTLSYDWAKLTPLVREFVGASFTATGSGTRGVSVSGQLNPPGAQARAPQPKSGGPIALKAPGMPAAKQPAGPSMFAAVSGEGAIGWQSIQAYGFDVGAGELKGRMTRGVLTVTPISATFGGGKVTLAPTVKLDTTPGEMSLAKGPVIERAKLTPQATAGALGYALPAIANAGQAEGEISAVIGDNRIPLGDIEQANLAGTLVIHKATVGASPVVAEVAKLLGAKNTTMTLANEEVVPVQVANGRVYHQNFSVRISGTTLRTSGSVGFDNTLDLVVDVPLPKELPALKNNPLLVKAVAGKIVKVPVKGTLSKPALDPKAFEAAVVALIREGAKDVGRDLLDKELQKLFPNMPAPKPGGRLPFPLPFGKK